MKKICWLLLCILILSLTGVSALAEIGGNLIVATSSTGDVGDVIQSILDDFMKEYPEVNIENQVNTTDYESLMKAKMAANDLPDVFATHGWSVERYSEYLLPLNDREWTKDIIEALKSSMYDKQGNTYALSTTVDMTGILVQMDILESLGLSIPTTIDEFFNCCKMASEAGYTGVFIAGKDTRSPAYVLDLMAPAFMLNSKAAVESNYAAALLDGTFQWENWRPLAEFLNMLKQSGYLNVDCATADTLRHAEVLVNKEALFIFQRNNVLTEAWEIDPKANIAFIPFPAATAQETSYLVGGEGYAFGVWKDSRNLDTAVALIDFFARPENVAKIAKATGSGSGLTGIEVDLGNLTQWYEKWENAQIAPWFDRIYLPSGMWAILRDTGSAIIANEASVDEVIAVMEENYINLRSQQ